MRALFLAILLLVTLPFAAFAVQPDEVLDNAALEARARQISQKLRCPVCQGENIDESNAAISRDLRLYVRERLVAGDSDTEVIDAVVSRFGEFVLFEPRARGGNLLLWLAGPLMALVALLVAWRFLRGRAGLQSPPSDLSDAEKDRLRQIMRD
ncbi:cytochrome c-type biogenesis protein [Paracoccus salsus]|uniref:cytochrome c-type biogenesis protein n=1 Tax=Paracoccus salsus TaxID=2911061 RepID=UPI001F3B469F|nr:cytochrome c-type biogenesis protein [Paracoccus salsus]MCF3974584.1 cytochrome c-type biogenesis protein CcmH [Paracoccus salsus]